MQMTTATQWQEQIEQVCANVGIQQVDLLLDQSAWNNCAVPALKMLRPEVPWFSLFSGTPEENLLDQAPLLMRLDLTHWQHKAWLEELMTHCAADARLVVVISPLPFEALSRALQALSQMKWGGQAGLLRYYDPRIFPLLMSSILTTEQRGEYLQAACYWGWLDRDDQPQWLQGNCQAHQGGIDVSPFLDLSDQQCDLIGCIGGAQQLLDGGDFDGLEESRELVFAFLYSLVVQASQENHFGDLTEYVRQKL
ncbi:hypothetical protein CU664_26865 [Pseudomonas syringae pv. actinidifoliorum]|uniref:DUF4123 domain-containing protein n=1 Tax=Pseudomonas syringae TaxID=317 RepID=UPI001372BB37|nr:DUF4123 domain-containing protein [Pseudomonas syringae]NAS99898.1 hypothetical protein [Pseudomonas syringae pv. actinidifoliorum]NAT66627.1 hypothetical protein [Pseudomonas syringae pv. actinidifoliorum]